MNEERLFVTGEHPDIPKQPTPGDRRMVPLTVYIGGIRRIIGEAVIEDDGRFEAYLDPKTEIGDALVDLVQSGVLQTASLAFNAPPATPVVDNEGHVEWHKNY